MIFYEKTCLFIGAAGVGGGLVVPPVGGGLVALPVGGGLVAPPVGGGLIAPGGLVAPPVLPVPVQFAQGKSNYNLRCPFAT